MIYSYIVLQRQLFCFFKFCVPRSLGQTLLTTVNKRRRVQGSKPTNSHSDDVRKPNSQHTQKCARAYEVPLPQHSSPLVVSVTTLWRLLTHSTDLDLNPNSYTITLSWTVFRAGSCADGQTLHQQQHHRHPQRLPVCVKCRSSTKDYFHHSIRHLLLGSSEIESKDASRAGLV